MSIELEQLEEVHQQRADVDLILCQLLSRFSAKVSLTLETSEEEHCEHGSVEDVSNLPLLVVVDQVEVVLVVARLVHLLPLLGLSTGLVVTLEQVLVLQEPLQRLLCDGSEEISFYKFSIVIEKA